MCWDHRCDPPLWVIYSCSGFISGLANLMMEAVHHDPVAPSKPDLGTLLAPGTKPSTHESFIKTLHTQTVVGGGRIQLKSQKRSSLLLQPSLIWGRKELVSANWLCPDHLYQLHVCCGRSLGHLEQPLAFCFIFCFWHRFGMACDLSENLSLATQGPQKSCSWPIMGPCKRPASQLALNPGQEQPSALAPFAPGLHKSLKRVSYSSWGYL